MMTVKRIKGYIEQNATPHAWLRVQLRLLPHFNKRGLFLHTMKGNEQLDEELVQLIRQELKDTYQLKLL